MSTSTGPLRSTRRQTLSSKLLRSSSTTTSRATHELPRSVPSPPQEWARPYRALAEEVGLDFDPAAGHRLAAAFLDCVLAAEPGLSHWDAEALGWRPIDRPYA